MKQIEMKDTWTLEEMKANRQAWIDVLRSGEFKQCTGRFYKDINGERCYCVWGVACKMFGDTFSNQHISDGDIPLSDFKDLGDSIPPQKVLNALGLENDYIMWGNGDTEIQYSLWVLNDDRKPFDELATIIETNKFLRSKF